MYQIFRRIRHAGRLRHKKAVEADQREFRRGELDFPVPDERFLDPELVEGVYAEMPPSKLVERYARTRDRIIESRKKIRRLKMRRKSKRAKQQMREACFHLTDDE